MSNAVFTRNELRQAVVDVLENRPNNSCKKDLLPNLVCRQLNIQFSGNARKKLKKAIKVVTGALIRANIIEEYKVANKRYRLESNFKDSLARLLNRGAGDDICFDGRATTEKTDTNDELNGFDDIDLSEEPTSLPPLSEPIDSPLFEPEDDEEDEDFTFEHEDDSEAVDPELLGVMAGVDDSTIEEKETDLEARPLSIKTADTNKKIVSLIESFAAGHPHLSCEAKINQVQLILNFNGMKTSILISYSRRTEFVAFRALLPDLTITPEKILIESGNDQFSCIPCLVRGPGGVGLQLRRTLPVTSEPEECVLDALDEVINDTVTLMASSKAEEV